MPKSAKTRILLATGIYPPDIGGPATYVKTLVQELPKRGFSVTVLTYGEGAAHEGNIYRISRSQPKLIRYWKYFWICWLLSRRVDTVYAFDIMSSGLPAALVARLRGRKFIIRIGGDFLWEKAVADGHADKPLRKYYTEPKTGKEKFYIDLNKRIMNSAERLVFTTVWLKDIYVNFYGIKPEKSVVIHNPFPNIDPAISNQVHHDKKKILYAGRLIRLKNLQRAIRAVTGITGVMMDIVGDGPESQALSSYIATLGQREKIFIRPGLEHNVLLNEIANCHIFILPSLSEISPNLVLECIKLGKPVMVTRECGLYEQYKHDLVFIDPLDVKDIKAKIEYLLDEDNYNAYAAKIKSLDTTHSWPQVIEEHEKLLT